jgi:hypothetical protein
MMAVRALVLLTSVIVASVTAHAQAGAERRIEGRVVRAVPNGRTAPLAGTWAVLHGVGMGGGAAIDSARTRADGSFAFRYRAMSDTNALYFVSTMRGGVAYFTPPTREAVVRGDAATLTVFDTTSRPVPIGIKARHIIVTAPDSSGTTRTVIEVYELENTDYRTRVAGDSLTPTFEAPLLAGVTEISGGEGDISPDAMRVFEGRVQVVAPIAPGLKQFSFVYHVPVDAAMNFTVTDSLPVLEIMVEDARGTASGGGLVEVSPTQVEGRAFKRFLAQNVPAPSVVDVRAPGRVNARLRIAIILLAVGAAMLGGLGMVFLRGGPQALTRRSRATPESLALKIAELDRAFAALSTPTEAQRAEHYVERARLKGELSALLAKRDGLA